MFYDICSFHEQNQKGNTPVLGPNCSKMPLLSWGLEIYIYIFLTPTWGNDPIWLKKVEMAWNHQLLYHLYSNITIYRFPVVRVQMLLPSYYIYVMQTHGNVWVVWWLFIIFSWVLDLSCETSFLGCSPTSSLLGGLLHFENQGSQQPKVSFPTGGFGIPNLIPSVWSPKKHTLASIWGGGGFKCFAFLLRFLGKWSNLTRMCFKWVANIL